MDNVDVEASRACFSLVTELGLDFVKESRIMQPLERNKHARPFTELN